MPFRPSNPFSSPHASPEIVFEKDNTVIESREAKPKSKRFSLPFKMQKSESPSSTMTMLETPKDTNPFFRPASPSFPAINLTNATAEKSKAEDSSKPLAALSQPVDPKRLAKQHAAFGPLGSKEHLYTSEFRGTEFPEAVEDEPPYYFLITTYISYLVLIIFGHVRDFFGKRFKARKYQYLQEHDGYAPLNSDFDNFYIRRLQLRINDCFRRPVTGVPGRFITLLDRTSDDFNISFKLTGTTTETLNLSSYNYLGFAQADGECADAAEVALRKYGVTFCSPRADGGNSDLHVEVERQTAEFMGKEAATVYSMGFGTNATLFPALVGKGCLLISDQLNHASIRFGARLSGAVIDMFKHNDMKDLERILRERIANGQPKTHRPWRKILVVVEGLYSMEGNFCNLPALAVLRRKYSYHLVVDEAHSVGAIGPRGRGVCDYFGISPDDVDVLMGTFTKSFGANGGYIAASKETIEKLKVTNAGSIYGETPSAAVLAQINVSLKIISGEVSPGQGLERLGRITFNSRYLRLGLKRLGFIVYGHDDSPIIPVLLYHPAKIAAFSHEMKRRKIAVVVVGYPATPLISSRARFCVSAAHTKDDMDRVLAACDQVGDAMQLKFASGVAGGQVRPLKNGQQPVSPRWKLEDVIARGVEDVKHELY